MYVRFLAVLHHCGKKGKIKTGRDGDVKERGGRKGKGKTKKRAEEERERGMKWESEENVREGPRGGETVVISGRRGKRESKDDLKKPV